MALTDATSWSCGSPYDTLHVLVRHPHERPHSLNIPGLTPATPARNLPSSSRLIPMAAVLGPVSLFNTQTANIRRPMIQASLDSTRPHIGLTGG